MANKRNELQLWLPSDFVTDEDIHINTGYRISDTTSGRFRFPTAFSKRCAPFNTGSALSSPVESVFGSTGTESEDEDFILSELTRQLTQKFSPAAYPTTHEKNLGSPQSTLAHVESWSGRSTVSSKGSSNGTSCVSSPPSTPLESNDKAWDLIYKAASLVDGLKTNSAGGQPSLINSGIFERQRSFSTTHPHPPPPNSPIHSSIHPNDLVRIEELLGYQVRSRQVIYNPNGCNIDRNVAGRIGSLGDSAPVNGRTWPNMQFGNMNATPQNNQQVRAGVTGGGLLSGGGYWGAALGYGCESGSGASGIIKSQRVGTGVFLPRKYGDNSRCNSVDSRKKSGYSSAYSANKVPIINNNLSHRSVFPDCQSQKSHGNTIADYEALARRASMLTLQRTTTSFPEVAINHELRLPQEWTY